MRECVEHSGTGVRSGGSAWRGEDGVVSALGEDDDSLV